MKSNLITMALGLALSQGWDSPVTRHIKKVKRQDPEVTATRKAKAEEKRLRKCAKRVGV